MKFREINAIQSTSASKAYSIPNNAGLPLLYEIHQNGMTLTWRLWQNSNSALNTWNRNKIAFLFIIYRNHAVPRHSQHSELYSNIHTCEIPRIPILFHSFIRILIFPICGNPRIFMRRAWRGQRTHIATPNIFSNNLKP